MLPRTFRFLVSYPIQTAQTHRARQLWATRDFSVAVQEKASREASNPENSAARSRPSAGSAPPLRVPPQAIRPTFFDTADVGVRRCRMLLVASVDAFDRGCDKIIGAPDFVGEGSPSGVFDKCPHRGAMHERAVDDYRSIGGVT